MPQYNREYIVYWSSLIDNRRPVEAAGVVLRHPRGISELPTLPFFIGLPIVYNNINANHSILIALVFSIQGKRLGQNFISISTSDLSQSHFEDTSTGITIAERSGPLWAFSALYTPFKYSRLTALRESLGCNQNFEIVCPSLAALATVSSQE